MILVLEYRNLSNKEYWAQRAEEKSAFFWAKEEAIEKEFQKQYLLVLEDIKESYMALLRTYGDGNTVSYAEVNKVLTAQELTRYKEKLKEIKGKFSGTKDESALLELDKLAKYKRLSRLQAQINNIKARLIELGLVENELLSSLLGESYEEAYYKTIYDVQYGTGFGASFVLLNSRAVEQAITYPWSGSMFSDNIWSNKELLLKNLKKVIVSGIVSGQSYWKVASNLHKTMSSTGYSNSIRIVRTEMAHIIEEASAEGYLQSGIVDQYSILATLDRKTSRVCQSQDGKVYKLKDKLVGTNFPPFHPNCRTTIVPYFEEQVVQQRIAKGADGKNYYVDGSMTYKEWSEKYLKNKEL